MATQPQQGFYLVHLVKLGARILPHGVNTLHGGTAGYSVYCTAEASQSLLAVSGARQEASWLREAYLVILVVVGAHELPHGAHTLHA